MNIQLFFDLHRTRAVYICLCHFSLDQATLWWSHPLCFLVLFSVQRNRLRDTLKMQSSIHLFSFLLLLRFAISVSTQPYLPRIPSSTGWTTANSFSFNSTKPSGTFSSSMPSGIFSPNRNHTHSTGKRGLAYNAPNFTASFSVSGRPSKVSWSFNWYSFPYTVNQERTGYNPAVEFSPMLWSTAADLTSVWSSNVEKSIADYGATTAVAFNEPDLCGSGASCMELSEAVSGYQTHMNPLAGKVRLGAPAVTNGEGPLMGLSWLSKFLDQCTGCHIDFIPIHWYGDASNTSAFERYVTQASKVAGKRPLWITEFGDSSGKPEATRRFLEETIAWLDENERVERYTWFWVAPGSLINANGTGLSELGEIYNRA